MRNSIKSTFCKFGLILFLAMVSIAGRAQVSGALYTMSMTATATANTIDVDLTVTATNPSQGLRFAGFSTTINFNPAIINGGTITAAYVPNSKSELLSALAPAVVNTATLGAVRLPTQTVPGSSGVDLAQGATIHIGTYRITNSVNWAAGNANLWLQPSPIVSGKTQSLVNGYPVGATTPAASYTTALGNLALGYSQAVPLSLSVGCSNTTSEQTVSACDSYTWTAGNGTTYTASGDYTSVTTVAGGCTDTKTLHLTITPNTTNGSVTTSACGSYTWPANGVTYTSSQSGVTVVSGCNTATLNLTITPNTTNGSVTTSACGSYTWASNGQTYYTTGVYTNVVGCNTATLNLTITPSTSNTTTASACTTYHWSVNDQDYTTSGTYTDTRNCHTEILELTITGATTHTTNVSACDTYTWTAGNGNTYTVSGDYPYVTGCHTETLHLTITPSTSNTTNVSTCVSYTWTAGDGNTYTESGDYPYVTGCHTETLHLVITPATITAQPMAPFICSTTGSTTTVSVTTDAESPTYTWQLRVVTTTNPNPAWADVVANANYSGQNTSTLTITKTAVTFTTGLQYRVVINSVCGDLTSDAVALTVITTIKAGTIVVPATVCLGSDITFSLTKYAATSVQWQSALNATSAFTDIPGATGPTYTIVGATNEMNKSYRAHVFSSCNNTEAFSAIKTIKVDPISVAGTATGGGVVCSGGGGTLKVAGYVGKIQWEYSTDGVNYVNAPAAAAGQTVPFGTTSTSSTASSYVVTNISTGLYFRAKLTSGTCSSAYTAPVQYTIGTAAVVGTASAANTLLCSGSGTTLTLSGATGTVTWQKATNLTTPVWTSIANSNLLSISTGNLTASTVYKAVVTIGSCSTVTSNLVIVNIVAKPLAKTITANVTTPSGSATAPLCTTDASKVLTAGVGTIGDIQWQRSTTSTTTGFTDISGATGPSYTIMNPSVGANYYRLRVTNTCGLEVFGSAFTVNYKDCTPAKQVVKTPFAVVAYPNPYTENFNLSLTTSSEDTVGVTIYDMTGKMIDKREVRPSDVS